MRPYPSEGALPALAKGRLTSSHIVRWCAAQENWDKIHYDQDFARDTARLPGTVINGALKQHFIAQFLANAFGREAWVWRLDYRFVGMDLVGQELEVRGNIVDSETVGAHVLVSVDVTIWNSDLGKATTTGRALVLLARNGEPVLSADAFDAPVHLCLDNSLAGSSGPVPEALALALGRQRDTAVSFVPVDLSRLRLFADAVMGLDPMHFDPARGVLSPHGCVVAPPLFPLHGIKEAPDSRPLSAKPTAFGREGVHEVGRDLASRFGLDPNGALNGGNRVEVASLAQLGDYIAADSLFMGAKRRTGPRGGNMLILETLNRYYVSGSGRLLVTERQTLIYRQVGE